MAIALPMCPMSRATWLHIPCFPCFPTHHTSRCILPSFPCSMIPSFRPDTTLQHAPPLTTPHNLLIMVVYINTACLSTLYFAIFNISISIPPPLFHSQAESTPPTPRSSPFASPLPVQPIPSCLQQAGRTVIPLLFLLYFSLLPPPQFSWGMVGGFYGV